MSGWIKCSDAMPSDGVIVDIWVAGYHNERMTNYRFIKNYGGRSGNNFFDPVKSGICCVRDATHWMPLPSPPPEQDK